MSWPMAQGCDISTVRSQPGQPNVLGWEASPAWAGGPQVASVTDGPMNLL